MNVFQILTASNSNASDNMEKAMSLLMDKFPVGIRFSDCIQSKAIKKNENDAANVPDYLNALCLARTELPLESTLATLKDIEAFMGRVRGNEAKGMVVIDLDLVVWNGTIVRPSDVAQSYYQECLKNLESKLLTIPNEG